MKMFSSSVQCKLSLSFENSSDPFKNWHLKQFNLGKITHWQAIDVLMIFKKVNCKHEHC